MKWRNFTGFSHYEDLNQQIEAKKVEQKKYLDEEMNELPGYH